MAQGADKVTYVDHVLPILQQSCLNCHNPDKAKGGLDLSTYAGAIKGGSGGAVVEPGDDGSRLLSAIRRSAEPVMPPEGEPLTKGQIQVLADWVKGGLLETGSSVARKTAAPRFEAVVKTDPKQRPDGPPPMPEHGLLEPPFPTERPGVVRAIAASPWAPLMAVAAHRQVLLHHAETGEPLAIIPFAEGYPRSLSFTPDGKYLLIAGGIGGKSGWTSLHEVQSGREVVRSAREFDEVLAADVAPGLSMVATGGPSRLIKHWSMGASEPRLSIKKHTDWVTALDISPDGVLMASGDRNGGVWVWETESGNEFHTLRAHQAAITAVAFRSDSNLLATASEDGTVRFWEMNGGTEVRKIDAHPGGVTGFCFARDGGFVTVGRDRKVRLWSPSFQSVRELAGGMAAVPTAVAIDGGGSTVMVGDAKGNLRLVATGDAKVLAEFTSNPPRVAERIASLESLLQGSGRDPAAPSDERSKWQQQLRKWRIAAVNTERLSAWKSAGKAQEELEGQFASFPESSRQVERAATIVQRRRNQWAVMASEEESAASWSPDARAEWEATKVILEAGLADELAELRRSEGNHLETARVLDGLAGHATNLREKAVAIDRRYFAMQAEISGSESGAPASPVPP